MPKKQNTQKKQVLVSIMGWTRDDEGLDDPMRLLTTGTLTGDKDAWRIDYTETEPDDGETHDVTLTLGRGVVTMQRTGQFATSMVFDQGRRFEGSYSTPYGELAMGVYPTHVRYRVDPDHMGEVNLTYQLDLQGQFAAMHELRIRFCPAGKS